MTRVEKVFQVKQLPDFLSKMLFFASKEREVVFLNNNQFNNQEFDVVLAFDAFTSIETDAENGFLKLHEFQTQSKDWLFGYLGYDLKNDNHSLTSSNFDGLYFPDLFFFTPKKMIFVKNNQVVFSYLAFCKDEIEEDFQSICNEVVYETTANVEVKQRISPEEYVNKVQKMQHYIQQGDIYEANFCMEFYAEEAVISPESIYWKLNSLATPPFSAYLKNNQKYALCSSPERYLKKEGQRVISQPIKGTAKRGLSKEEDTEIKLQLEQSEKERTENIMIVDLVRNDLSVTAIPNSVKVDELCKVYTFSQVHQMISTISSVVDLSEPSVRIIETTFPMGSMTGAPKKSAMQIIEELEETKRGLYSGAIGYFTPEGDFDFNVVIRSILYNQQKKYLSFSVGSAITISAIPEKEYEECLLKAQAMINVLS